MTLCRRRALGALGAAALAASVAAAGAARASGPLFSTLDEVDAALFVLEDFLNGDATIAEVARLYADQVTYFDEGILARTTILDYRRDFLSRWSSRSYTPDLATLLVRRDGERRFIVQIEVDFMVRNAAAQLSGRSLVDLTIERRGEEFEVVREAGRVLVQN